MTAAEKRHRAEIGGRIRERRRARNLTQRQAAEHMDAEASQLCHWEAGRNAPSTIHLEGISRVLDVSIDWLVTGREFVR